MESDDTGSMESIDSSEYKSKRTRMKSTTEIYTVSDLNSAGVEIFDILITKIENIYAQINQKKSELGFDAFIEYLKEFRADLLSRNSNARLDTDFFKFLSDVNQVATYLTMYKGPFTYQTIKKLRQLFDRTENLCSNFLKIIESLADDTSVLNLRGKNYYNETLTSDIEDIQEEKKFINLDESAMKKLTAKITNLCNDPTGKQARHEDEDDDLPYVLVRLSLVVQSLVRYLKIMLATPNVSAQDYLHIQQLFVKLQEKLEKEKIVADGFSDEKKDMLLSKKNHALRIISDIEPKLQQSLMQIQRKIDNQKRKRSLESMNISICTRCGKLKP